MTVYVHRGNASVQIGGQDHAHTRPEHMSENERTWPVDCPQCEARILHDVEHSALSPDSVPLTPSEKSDEKIREKLANKSWGELMDALKSVAQQSARDRVAV